MPYPSPTLYPQATGLYPGDGGEIPPTVTTSPASGVTTTAATLRGTINPNGLQTNYYFEYGWGPDPYGNQTVVLSAGTAMTAGAISKPISGLTSARHYHFRLVAYSAAGFGYGADRTFNTDYGRDDRRHSSPHGAGRGQ